VIAGHDWGAPVAWHAALLRPDRFRAVIGLSVPFRPRGLARPSTVMPQTHDAVFYQQYFQPPGVAEAELEQDVRASICSVLLSLAGEARTRSGDALTSDNFSMVPRQGGLLTRITHDARHPPALPSWITDADIDFYAGEFLRTGFRGGLNWYRNIDRNWELLSPFNGSRVTIPALYVAGERDLVLGFPGARDLIANLPKFVPQLRETMILPGCGHWTQQERPSEVNEAMITFLNSL
jgi:pimeloyl-ACP methyl ester carboxylesterase